MADEVETENEKHGYTVAVMLLPCDGMTIDSENPVRVEPGGDAVFSVTISDDMQLDSLSRGAVYNDGKVTVPGVYMPLTIAASCSKKPETDIPATPGGIDEPTADSLAAPEGYYLVIYHANGGTLNAYAAKALAATVYGTGTLAVRNSASFYLCPNALANKGYFTRNGYALLGYNTMPDGSGDFYACGWNIIMPSSRVIDLYAVWAAETPAEDFTFSVTNGKAAVTGYCGSGNVVVIPEYYGDYPVVSIAAGAFRSASFSKVYLTRGLETVEKNAFYNCAGLDTVYMSDSIMSISDASFLSCKNLKNLMISAVRDPVYTTNKHGTYSVKFELLYTAKKRKVMVVCGSNTAYGLDSVRLMDSLDFDATVVNFGFNWITPSLMQMEIALRFSNPGDILLLAPELTEAQFGGVAAYTTMWQMFESCYEAISYVNIQNYTGIFDTFASFNQTRARSETHSYDNYVSDVNIYGDYTVYRTAQPADYNRENQKNLDFNISTFLTDERVARMNAMFDRFINKSCYVWMSFASINYNGLSEQSKNAAYRAAWVDALKSKLHATLISDIENYIYPGNYFFDSNFHLSTEATKIRTMSLAEDMNNAFKSIK
jgi:hypothetical protein